MLKDKAVVLLHGGLPCIWGWGWSTNIVLRRRSASHSGPTLPALNELGGSARMVVGAKLRQKMVAVGLEEQLNVGAYVEESGQPFSRLVEQVPGVVVRRRPGRDVLVGTPQAEEPEWDAASPTRRGALRGDVYQAFTRIAPAPVVYSPDTDRFLAEEKAEGRSIRVPDVTLETLIQDRRQFAESLAAEMEQPLMDALTRSPNPLSAFRHAVGRLGIPDKWGQEQSRIVWQRVETWAAENSVTPRVTWQGRGQTVASAHHTLSKLADYMTASEIRQLKIPFRAVEALLSERDRR